MLRLVVSKGRREDQRVRDYLRRLMEVLRHYPFHETKEQARSVKATTASRSTSFRDVPDDAA